MNLGNNALSTRPVTRCYEYIHQPIFSAVGDVWPLGISWNKLYSLNSIELPGGEIPHLDPNPTPG